MKTPNQLYQVIGEIRCRTNTLFFAILLCISSVSFSQQIAFPSAEGFGRFATGGRGGSVIKVTNLNDSGSGSLRAALTASGTRTIVFEVGGTINLNSAIYVDNGNFTLAGQTAPGDGILIRGSMIQIQGSNSIIRFIRFRPGPSATNTPDGLSITAWQGTVVEDVIVDHCSISWADDENFDVRAVGSGVVRDITLQNSIVSENNYGALAGEGTYNKTYYKNLFAHNRERNIRTNYPSSGTFDFEMINNVIYGFRWATSPSLGSKFTVLNNHYRKSSQVQVYGAMVDGSTSGQGTPSQTHAYIDGNIKVSGTQEYSDLLAPYIKANPYNSSGINPMSANLVADDILSHVGCSFPSRDSVDDRLINQYNNGNGTLASSGSYPIISGGTAPVDSDNDGMPDYWELDNGLNINNASDRNIVQADGYTNLEHYLNWLINGDDPGEPVNANAGPNKTICEGESTTLTASGGGTYQWNNGANTQSITVSPSNNTTYTVTVTVDGSSDSDSATVFVNDAPNANAGNNVTIDQGESTTLTASGGGSYSWNNGSNSQSITVSPNSTTTYTVEVTNNAGCIDTDSVTVFVNTNNGQTTANAGEDQTICSGGSATLTASGGSTYQWSNGATTASITVSPNYTKS